MKACAAVLAGAACFQAVRTVASSFYWEGDNNNLWNQTAGLPGTNWSSSSDFNLGTAGVPGSADDVFFNLVGASNLTTELGRTFTINSLTFTPDATSSVTIADTPGTHTLTIGAGGLTDNSSVAHTISAGIVAGATTETWTNNSATPLTFSGVISGGSSTTLSFAGPGTFVLSAANTYAGNVTLSTAGTTLNLDGANGALTGINSLTVGGGATLNLDSRTGSGGNQTSQNRLSDSLTVASNGATIALLGADGTSTTESINSITLGSGASKINVTPGAGGTATLTLGSAAVSGLTRPSVGATVAFSSLSGVVLPKANLSNGILGGWAVIGKTDNSGSLDFATVDGSNNVIALPTYTSDSLTSGTGTNVKVDNVQAVSASTAVNSLYLTGGGQITFTAGTTLTVGSGGLISNGATSTVNAGGNQPAITNATIIGAAASTGSITATSGSDLVLFASSNMQINAVISGNIGLTKSGNGLVDLSNENGAGINNTYTGITTINEGIVKVKQDLNLGAAPSANTPNAITFNGGTLETASGFNFATTRGITVGPQGGTLRYVGGSAWRISQTITGPGGVTFFADPLTNTNNTGGSVPFVILNNSGNTYKGPTFLTTDADIKQPIDGDYGVIQFGVNNPIPDFSAVTATETGTDNTGSKGIVDMNGKNVVMGSLAGNMSFMGFSGTLTVGDNNSSTTYGGALGAPQPVGPNLGAGVFSNVGNGGSLVKVGTGTFTLSGANLYTGTTTIGSGITNGGTLLVTGTLASSSVIVGDVGGGGHTAQGALGGSGIISGAVTVNTMGHLAPAVSPTSTSTLTINSDLTLNAGATLDYNFQATGGTTGTPGTSDLTLVTGSGNLNLPTNLTLNLTELSGFGIGIYKLLDVSGSTGSLSGTGTVFNIDGSNLFNYVVLTGDGTHTFSSTVEGGNSSVLVPAGTVFLEVLQGNPLLYWTGSTNGKWDTATANWTSASSGNHYSDGANVNFDDGQGGGTVPSNTTIILQGAVTPHSITFGNESTDYTFSGGSITSGTSITKTLAGNVTFNENVTTTNTTVSGGTLTIGAGTTYNSTSGVTVNSGGALAVQGLLTAPTLTITSGSSASVAAGTGSLPSTLTVQTDGALNLNNSAQTLASLNGGSTGSVALNGTALTLAGAGTFAGTISGTNGSLIINVPNDSVTLSGANTYANGTGVQAGTLVVANTAGSATGTGPVSVLSGATLTGAGFITGPTSIGNGGILTPGTNGTGTLSLGDLTLIQNSVLNYQIGAPGTNNTMTVGALSFDSGGQITINVNGVNGIAAGSWILADASGAVTGFTSSSQFNIVPSGTAVSPAFDFTTSIVNGVGGHKEFELTLAVASFTFTGAGGPFWDTSTPNWTSNPIGLNTYVDGGNVTFDDTNTSGNSVIAISGTVNPNSITVDNSATGPNPVYSIGSGGAIGGLGGLTKNGNGTLILTSANTFTGKTIVNGGILSISEDSNLGMAPGAAVADQLQINGSTLQFSSGVSAGTAGNISLATTRGVTISNGATLDLTGVTFTASGSQIGQEFAVVYNGVITGTGDLTILGSGGGLAPNASPAPQSILDFGAPATYTGKTTVNNAIVQVNSGASGTTNSGSAALINVLPATTTLNLINNGAFDIDSGSSALTVAGLTGDATGRFGTVNQTSASALTLNGSGTYNFPGVIGALEVAGKTGSDATISLTKAGAGTQILSGSNTYTGATTINGGSLVITGSISGSTTTINGGSLSGTGTVGPVNVATGGTISPGNPTGTLNSGNFSLAAGGQFSLQVLSSTQYSQLNVTGTVTLGGAISDSLIPGYVPHVGDVFYLIVNDGTDPVTGEFSNTTDNPNGTFTFDAPDGSVFTGTYTANVDPVNGNTFTPGTGNDVALELVQAVPEPGSALAFLSGAGILLGLQRFRRGRA